MNLNRPISCCSGARRREKPRSCWSDFTKRELPFALKPGVLLLSLGRRLSSISVWTQRELAKSLRFTAIFLGMDRRIIAHLSFLSIATSNQSMKPTVQVRNTSSCVCHETLPWLISASLGLCLVYARKATNKQQ